MSPTDRPDQERPSVRLNFAGMPAPRERLEQAVGQTQLPLRKRTDEKRPVPRPVARGEFLAPLLVALDQAQQPSCGRDRCAARRPAEHLQLARSEFIEVFGHQRRGKRTADRICAASGRNISHSIHWQRACYSEPAPPGHDC